MKTILGLDLGTNSIGWAVINSVIKEQTERIWIEMAGSRIIPMDAAILGDFDKGNSISQTAERTRFRGVRRLRERQLLRRERLHKVLKILGFLPEHYLKGIDFEVLENQVVSLIGPSGSGKSTLLRCLNGLEEATEGHIYVDGSDITDPKLNINHFRENVGMVFQSFNLFPHLKVIDNITLAPVTLNKMSKTEAEELGLRLLDQVGLKEKAEMYPNSLSGGQKQRIGIARAFLKNAPILILDEATSSIDTRTEAIVQKGMDQLMKGRTVFVIAHRLSTVKNSDKIMVLEAGKIIESGNHQQLINLKGKYYELYTGAFHME